MLKARDIMTAKTLTVSPDMEITEAAQLLLKNHINGLPVIDNHDRVVGVLCQSDLIRQQKKIPMPSFFTILDAFIASPSLKSIQKEIEKIAATTVAKAMTINPVTVSLDTDIGTIAELMVDKNFHTLPVVENEKLVGVIGKEDILKTLIPETSE